MEQQSDYRFSPHTTTRHRRWGWASALKSGCISIHISTKLSINWIQTLNGRNDDFSKKKKYESVIWVSRRQFLTHFHKIQRAWYWRQRHISCCPNAFLLLLVYDLQAAAYNKDREVSRLGCAWREEGLVKLPHGLTLAISIWPSLTLACLSTWGMARMVNDLGDRS